MAQQTAVEFIEENLNEFNWEQVFDRAKQMEKEQIIKAHGLKGWAKPVLDNNGVPKKDGTIFGTTTVEDYYNETYTQ